MISFISHALWIQFMEGRDALQAKFLQFIKMVLIINGEFGDKRKIQLLVLLVGSWPGHEAVKYWEHDYPVLLTEDR